MKKVLFITMCLAVSSWVYAQQITGVKVAEVLASDDFEGKAPWVNFDSPDVEHALNNALGGTQAYEWSANWGGAAVHPGKSAISGTQCVQLHWGGNLVLQGFEIDPAKIYQLEVMIHPVGGKSGDWNDYGSVHLFIFDNPNMWQTQGIRVRVSNNYPEGLSPSWFAYDTWYGDDGVETHRDLLSFSNEISKYTISDAAEGLTPNFWIPLKLVFGGAGTAENPFIMDFYLNDLYIDSQEFNDIVWFGDRMIGLGESGGHEDVARFDNFKLTLLEKEGTGIKGIAAKNETSVIQSEKGVLNIKSTVYGENAIYELFSVTGARVAKGNLKSETTSVPVKTQSGVYILKVSDAKSGVSNVVRTVIK